MFHNFKLEIKLFFIVAVVSVLIATAGILLLKTMQPASPAGGSAPAEQEVFASQEECEADAGYECMFQMCDYIPPSKTFEEVCGENFRKGWVATMNVLKQESVTNNEQSAIDISTWQTYRNDEFGFEVRYPRNLFVAEHTNIDDDDRHSIVLWFSIDRKIELEEIPPGAIAPPGNFVDTVAIDIDEATDKTGFEDYSLNHMEYATLGPYRAIRIFPDTSPYFWPGYIMLRNGKEYVLSSTGSDLGEQILSTFRFVDRDITSGILLTLEDVLSSPGMYDREEIEVHGIIELIPFVDSFGLGGASPGFKTAIGNITVSNWDYVWDAAQNRSEVLVRGVFDASSNFISFPNGCAECFRNISPQL